MKKILNIAVLSTLILLGSCKKFLEEKPLSEASLNQFYKSKFDADAALAGMYAAFQEEMVGGGVGATTAGNRFSEKYLYWGEYRSDNYDRAMDYTNVTIDEIAMNSLTPVNIYSDWTGLYNIIGRANNNIKYLPQVAELDVKLTQQLLDSYMSQSYAMRALSYFFIVRVWGDAPIRTEPYEDLSKSAELPRDPKDKIINEVIIPDLEKAYSLITKGERPVVFYIGEAAICAILADVYMWQKDYPNAIKWIENLFKAKTPTNTIYNGVNENDLEPTASWKNIFATPASSKEAIFSIHWDFARNNCACMQTSWAPNNKQIIIDQEIWNTWFLPARVPVPQDIRPKQIVDLYASPNPAQNKRDRSIKWYPTPANPTTAAPWTANDRQALPVYLTVYRLADIYLLYAEALNGSNDLPNALKYLNFVRKRAGIPEYDIADPEVATKADMERAILEERRKELFGEGKRWFDLMRTNRVKEVMDPILIRRQAGSLETPGFVDPENRAYWPISRIVLNSNNKLVQNTGYTD